MTNVKHDLIAFFFSIAISVSLGAVIIPLLKKLKAGQNILGYVDNHAGKAGTTTMGGLIFALSAFFCYFVFSQKHGVLSKVLAAVAFAYLVVGFLDDFIKIKGGKNEGLTAKQKLLFQCAIALVISVFTYLRGYTDFFIPFVNKYYDLGIFGSILIFFVFIATTNCVNLTDGLDGLASGVSYVVLLCFYFLINLQVIIFQNNFVSPAECEDVAFFCLMQAGALIGFLQYNTFSASVFMGDTGSLYLGGFIASAAIFCGNTFFIPFFGIMFVVSGISVIVQVFWFKKTGKRVFLMAPLHHHFEYKGHSESKIVFTYKLVTLLVGILCIISVLRG